MSTQALLHYSFLPDVLTKDLPLLSKDYEYHSTVILTDEFKTDKTIKYYNCRLIQLHKIILMLYFNKQTINEQNIKLLFSNWLFFIIVYFTMMFCLTSKCAMLRLFYSKYFNTPVKMAMLLWRIMTTLMIFYDYILNNLYTINTEGQPMQNAYKDYVSAGYDLMKTLEQGNAQNFIIILFNLLPVIFGFSYHTIITVEQQTEPSDDIIFKTPNGRTSLYNIFYLKGSRDRSVFQLISYLYNKYNIKAENILSYVEEGTTVTPNLLFLMMISLYFIPLNQWEDFSTLTKSCGLFEYDNVKLGQVDRDESQGRTDRENAQYLMDSLLDKMNACGILATDITLNLNRFAAHLITCCILVESDKAIYFNEVNNLNQIFKFTPPSIDFFDPQWISILCMSFVFSAISRFMANIQIRVPINSLIDGIKLRDATFNILAADYHLGLFAHHIKKSFHQGGGASSAGPLPRLHDDRLRHLINELQAAGFRSRVYNSLDDLEANFLVMRILLHRLQHADYGSHHHGTPSTREASGPPLQFVLGLPIDKVTYIADTMNQTVVERDEHFGATTVMDETRRRREEETRRDAEVRARAEAASSSSFYRGLDPSSGVPPSPTPPGSPPSGSLGPLPTEGMDGPAPAPAPTLPPVPEGPPIGPLPVIGAPVPVGVGSSLPQPVDFPGADGDKKYLTNNIPQKYFNKYLKYKYKYLSQ